MNKPLSEWTILDVVAFFEKHDMTPQQIIPVFGSGALQMAMMASSGGENPDMENYYRDIAGELLSIVTQDLCHKMADHRTI